jgi:ATP-dependent DNA helicase DinG
MSISITLPALCVTAHKAAWLSADGEMKSGMAMQAAKDIEGRQVIVCHAPYTTARLDFSAFHALDILELFAFVHPAKFCVPTPVGLCRALGVAAPTSFDDWPMALVECANALLTDLMRDEWAAKADPIKIAGVMGANGRGWGWTPHVFAALGKEYDIRETIIGKADLNVWKNLPEWAEEAPPPPATHDEVSATEAQARLSQILGPNAEKRVEQFAYTATMAQMFDAKNDAEEPHAVLTEAGTGVGKTLGYLAPASVWADKNGGAVWVSTYTKNLQRQIDQELSRLYPDAQLKDNKVAVRKGRENYLCLLNFEDLASGATLAKDARQAVAAGLMARWAAATRDGDMQGGDFPGWLSGLLGYQYTTGQSDRRGECIYAACDHYHRCFIERSVRKSQHASIVVANHALVMINAALSGVDDDMPSRYVFDEGHHLFDAADGAFAGHLTAREGQDLRRWIRGNEGGKKSRARGLKKRAEGLCEGDESLQVLLDSILEEARCLTSDGWGKRLKDNEPKGPMEAFLVAVYAQVMARGDAPQSGYSIETPTRPLGDGLAERAIQLKRALESLQKPMVKLAAALRKKLVDQADTLDSDTRRKLDSVAGAIDRRALMTLGAWIDMLASLEAAHTPEGFVDWMELERIDGRSTDLGLYRHHVDPMVPFANAIKPHAHGIAVTSATLRDGTDNEAENWRVAGLRSGLSHLTPHMVAEKFASPFDYNEATKVIVIDDVNKNDLEQVASAYRILFEASGGGALGLFTAISRLRAVHERIAAPLEAHGLPLYAQHIDAMDNGTLVDIFRDDVHASLLGTDAVRDGVDVPGESLRLIVFDRIPWPRPTILHKARREAFGKGRYDDMLTRLKLKQAYGRLIRRAGDKGVFVMLDSALPSRLHGAFPDNIIIERTGLVNAADIIRNFLATKGISSHKAA